MPRRAAPGGAPRGRWGKAALLGLALAMVPSVVLAEDTWTTVRPGIEHLHRTAAGPQDYHVVLVDLTRPEIWLRATGPGQNGQRTSAFAASLGATLAINGDLWDADNWSAYEPLGLAVGDGWQWRDDTDTWSFLACDVTRSCWYDPWGNLAAFVPRAFNAIGGMQDLLVIEGVPQSYGAAYYSQRNPRTATGVTQDGSTLILLVADGRRSGAIGMTFADMTAVMMELGAWYAMNSDGGGSSTLVIDGAVRNVPSDGSERIVANHLAIMVSDGTDPACVGVENSRLCIDGTRMRTCTGGLDRGEGDCAFYGMTCEEEDLFAFCVDPRCASGGNAAFCLDETRIAICEYGRYREGDCAGYGLPCVEGLGTAWCWADFRKAEPVASSLGAAEGGTLSLRSGEQASVWFELRNVGLVTWAPNVTRMAPLPRDASSALAGPDWISPTRVATISEPVPPGELGRFTFTLLAPGPGTHSLALGLLDEGVTWFADAPSGGGPEDGRLQITLVVADAPDGGLPTDGGPTGDPDGGAQATPDSGGCGCHGAPWTTGQRKGAPGDWLLMALMLFLALGKAWRPPRAR